MLGPFVPLGSRLARAGSRLRFCVGAAAVVIAATSCSSGGKVASGQSSPPVNPSTSTSASSAPSGQPSGATSTPPSSAAPSNGTSAAPTASATPGGSASPSASRPPLPLTATLARACVQPGQTQTLHVHTLPNAVVIYDNFYSDGHDGAVWGGRGTGGQADAQGNYAATWRVLPGAPTGRVKVEVAAAGGHSQTGSREVYYDLKTLC
jgi:hypothetical protein